MIRLDMPQGTPEWMAARCGIPTASSFGRILTPKTMKVGAGARTYLCELAAERLLGSSLDPYISEWMERGLELEGTAIDYYELQRELETEEVGHCLTDDKRAGCSPDRLIGEDGGLEIKCPSATVHIGYLLEVPARFRAQIQGGLWITERKWWDLLSYHPELPPLLVRFARNEDYIAALAAAVAQFCDELDAGMAQLAEQGIVPVDVAERLGTAEFARG